MRTFTQKENAAQDVKSLTSKFTTRRSSRKSRNEQPLFHVPLKIGKQTRKAAARILYAWFNAGKY